MNYELHFETPKTPKGRRVIDLDAGMVAVLRAHRTRQLEERLARGPAYQDSGLVFTRKDGSLIHPDRFSQMLDLYVARSGLPRIRLHDLRHAWASLALQAGVNPKVVSERLGHATVAFTLDVCSHVIPGMQAEAAERVATRIFGSEA
jgi:integrase